MQAIPLCAGKLSGSSSFTLCALLSWLGTLLFLFFSDGAGSDIHREFAYGSAEKTDGNFRQHATSASGESVLLEGVLYSADGQPQVSIA